jgi:hypothetical protein
MMPSSRKRGRPSPIPTPKPTLSVLLFEDASFVELGVDVNKGVAVEKKVVEGDVDVDVEVEPSKEMLK